MRIRFSSLLITLLGITLFSCNSNEIGKAEDVSPDAIYFDYQISGEDGNPEATVFLQYKFGGENGTTLTIDTPGKVEVDGIELKPDSTRFVGAFYETQQPLEKMTGQHSIRFTNPGGKSYDEEFNFIPFSLDSEIKNINRDDSLIIYLKGVKDDEKINVNLSDTVFGSNGVEKDFPVYDGKILISKDELKELSKGPISFRMERVNSRPIKKGTLQGGRLTTKFTLSRELMIN